MVVFAGCVRSEMSRETTVRDPVDAAAVWPGISWKNRTMTILEAVVPKRPQYSAVEGARDAVLQERAA
jgi:hypothetical protein